MTERRQLPNRGSYYAGSVRWTMKLSMRKSPCTMALSSLASTCRGNHSMKSIHRRGIGSVSVCAVLARPPCGIEAVLPGFPCRRGAHSPCSARCNRASTASSQSAVRSAAGKGQCGYRKERGPSAKAPSRASHDAAVVAIGVRAPYRHRSSGAPLTTRYSRSMHGADGSNSPGGCLRKRRRHRPSARTRLDCPPVSRLDHERARRPWAAAARVLAQRGFVEHAGRGGRQGAKWAACTIFARAAPSFRRHAGGGARVLGHLRICPACRPRAIILNSPWGYCSAGRALAWHARGQRFDPAYLHHSTTAAYAATTVEGRVPIVLA